ncbi:hypothetical protein PRIPAC_83781 [Pristionchus pacificus]|uniref:Glutaredoxin domain-containing protein n=1 Tax=Pristionchus pacificus TaxID=54126 RepID=A0A2A6BDE3_PRIPA|nr:hypothetical protein PRIPAC_83781 [Pristionchus pacificus]|eukprot:PDM63894.1 hypothetical protein PRIPAC_53677 [Pristionchus pacificus]
MIIGWKSSVVSPLPSLSTLQWQKFPSAFPFSTLLYSRYSFFISITQSPLLSLRRTLLDIYLLFFITMSTNTNTPNIKVYITTITANTEIRKQVQRALMILEGLRIPFKAIDITKPGMEEERAFMKEKAHNRRCSKTVLPPQFFVDDDYVGDYFDFEESVEEDKLEQFLKLTPILKNSRSGR